MHASTPTLKFSVLVAIFLVMCWKCSIQYETLFFATEMRLEILDEVLIAFGSQHNCVAREYIAQHYI